jgi:hypothetical protein
MKRTLAFLTFILLFFACGENQQEYGLPWENHGKLVVTDGTGIIQHEDGTPFLWLGCTSWGMTEWLSREEVDLYLNDRKSKGMNVVQFCLFWGKRVDYPTKFTANAPNFYSHKAFDETDGFPDATRPAIIEGGSPENPNDYWDHVDYCLSAIRKRGMYAAVLPFWGRRYVNATQASQSLPVFNLKNIDGYGKFLGERYGNEPNIIWVSGGDVKADAGGDFLPHYRLFAEGLVKGVTGQDVKWNQPHEAWDKVLMTYHPDGTPMVNSSKWFHSDPWLDFNMIETYVYRDFIANAVHQDLNLDNPKPTVLGEPHYEGITNDHKAEAINMRRQAYQSFFAGAAGFTYGGGFDEEGNGPLFSPANNWELLLEWEGAGQMLFLKNFLQQYEWWAWKPANEIITDGKGDGELEKVAVKKDESCFVYFPDNTSCKLTANDFKSLSWYNTETGQLTHGSTFHQNEYSLPEDWEDGVLILE